MIRSLVAAGAARWPGVRSSWGLWLAGAIGLLAYGGLAVLDWRHGTLRAGVTSRSVAWYLVAFGGFGLAVWWNERQPIDRRLLWALPIIFRLLMLTTEPTLSDDVYRYLWDGHLVTEGVNPYSHAIDAPELDRYTIPARRLANNPSLSSPYLPAAHAVFAAAALVLPSQPISLQLVMTGFDLGSALLLTGLLARAGLPARRVLIYLWNPLVIVEIAHGSHIDAVLVFFSLLAASAVISPTRTLAASWVVSPLALAAATLTRIVPILLAPVLWWRWTVRQRVLFAMVSIVAVVPFGLGPAGFGLVGDPTGRGVFGAARVYGQDFRFNAGPGRWIETATTAVAESISPTIDATTAANLVIGSIMATILAMVWHVARPDPSAGSAPEARRALRLMSIPVMAYVLLTPVMHPWYLLLLVAWLAFLTPADGERPARWLLIAPWLHLAATLPLSYLTYRDPAAFQELVWVRRIEWWPTVAALAVIGPMAWRRRWLVD